MKKKIVIRIIGSNKQDSLASMLLESLQFLGYEVKIVDAFISFDSGVKYKIVDNLGLGGLNFSSVSSQLDNADVVFVTYRNLPFNWMNQIRALPKSPYIIHYNGDHIGTIDKQELLMNKYDLYITKSFELNKLYRSLEYNSLLLDEASSLQLLKENDLNNISGDIVLLGSIYPYRLKLLTYVDTGIKLYSNLTKGIQKDDLMKHHELNGTFIFGDQKVNVIQNSLMVFNPFHFMDLADLTQKFFEFGGLDVPQVVPKTKRLIELFGKEISDFIGYSEPHEIQRTINRIKENYIDASDIARELFIKIKSDHTYINRLKLVMEYYESSN